MSGGPMTDPSRIRALITRLESEGGSREADFQYADLVLGWTAPGWRGKWRRPDGNLDDDSPHFTTNAQDALDSLPEVWTIAAFFDSTGDFRVHLEPTTEGDGDVPDYVGNSDHGLAAAICLARLNMELAKLEGG